MLKSTRRHTLKTGLAAFSALALIGCLAGTAGAQTAAPPPSDATKVPEMELMAAEALPDVVQGKADATVTVVEYASMTCTHCAHFHETTYPTLIKNYVDTGKVKFILREFPLDPLATAGFMLARCSGDKRAAVVDLLFDKQKDWAFVDKPLEALADILKQTGMSKDAFEACLKDQKLYDNVVSIRDRGSEKFHVTATPTFYVNGEKVTGEVNPELLAKILDPLVNKKS